MSATELRDDVYAVLLRHLPDLVDADRVKQVEFRADFTELDVEVTFLSDDGEQRVGFHRWLR